MCTQESARGMCRSAEAEKNECLQQLAQVKLMMGLGQYNLKTAGEVAELINIPKRL